MRTLKIIYHDRLERVHTISVHYIYDLSFHKNVNDPETSFVSIFYRADSSVIKLPTKKAYELYNKLASWFSDEVTNLRVSLISGTGGEVIDYTAVEE